MINPLERGAHQAAERVLTQADMSEDRGAWQQLMDLYAPLLAAYLGARLRRHEVVEKLVCDTIDAAWRHRDEYSSDQNFGAWFRRLGPIWRCVGINAIRAIHWRKFSRQYGAIAGIDGRCL